MSAEVMMSLPPPSHGSAVITCAEVRVENFRAWARALNGPERDLRWSVDELVEFMGAAWVTAAEMLPELIEADGPDLMTPSFWGGVPRMELSISAESPHSHDPGRQLLLADVVDLGPLGHSDRRDQLTELFVSVPSAPGLNPESRRHLIRSVLVEMAHSYGFMQVQETVF